MTATGVFPTMVLQMTAIGEESGSLDHMLGKAAEFYEEEVDDMVTGLSSLMESREDVEVVGEAADGLEAQDQARHLQPDLILMDINMPLCSQQILTGPQEYSVLATPNLNGDYLADACAAQVGGLRLAPGANIGDDAAVFEAVHGTAPKYAGKNLANPCSLMLSGAMMLEHFGMNSAAVVLVGAISSALSEGVLTQDLSRLTSQKKYHGTKEFADEVIQRL